MRVPLLVLTLACPALAQEGLPLDIRLPSAEGTVAVETVRLSGTLERRPIEPEVRAGRVWSREVLRLATSEGDQEIRLSGELERLHPLLLRLPVVLEGTRVGRVFQANRLIEPVLEPEVRARVERRSGQVELHVRGRPVALWGDLAGGLLASLADAPAGQEVVVEAWSFPSHPELLLPTAVRASLKGWRFDLDAWPVWLPAGSPVWITRFDSWRGLEAGLRGGGSLLPVTSLELAAPASATSPRSGAVQRLTGD